MKTSERWCIINAEMNNKRIRGACECPGGLYLHLECARPDNEITKRYLNLPVSHQVDRALMTFDVGGRQERVFEIRLASGKTGLLGVLRYVCLEEQRDKNILYWE